MEPEIQYARTSDGVNIAFYAIGEGEPLLVATPLGPSHIGLERRFAPLIPWLEHIATHRTLIRWDARNSGMSDRHIEDMSLDAAVRDVEAVLEKLHLQRVDVLGAGPGNIAVISLAAHRPDLVGKLILINPLLRSLDFYPGAQGKAVLELGKIDWELFTETATRARLGWSRAYAHDYAEIMREGFLQADFLRWLPQAEGHDVRSALPKVRAETVVVHSPSNRFARQHLRAAREIAAIVPGAKVVEATGTTEEAGLMSPDVQRKIDELLGIETSEQDPASGSGRTAVILFADIADSTALTERLGDAAFRDKARELDAALRRAITSNGGTAIDGKLLGDGVLATFGAAREAIGCAAAIHAAGSHAELPLHVGIHAGDVIREDDNVYGGAVNIASRVANEAAGGETLVSGTVRDLARTSAGVSFEDRGERELKGVGEPVRVYAVRSGA